MNPERAAGWLVFAACLAIAPAVEHLYPLSTLPLYGSPPQESASRLLVLHRDGGLSYPRDWPAWSCESTPDPRPEACRSFGVYHRDPGADARALHAVDASAEATDDAEPVWLIRRVWRVGGQGDEGQGLRHDDCVLARCKVGR